MHDWLTNLGGAERVVAAMTELYPEADLYTSVYNSKKLRLFKDRQVNTSFLQRVPLTRSKHQLFSAWRRLAFESIDFSDYDVVISSTTAEAKGIITSERTRHISYMNTPTRYYWSHYEDYLKEPGFGALNPLARWQLKRTIDASRYWDFAAAQRPDVVLANSETVQRRIKKYYERDSTVLYPCVDTARFETATGRPEQVPAKYALITSRLVSYKRVDVAIQAAQKAGWPLYIIGQGPQLKALRQLAGPQTHFLGALSDEETVSYTRHADVFLFPGEEDFGITPVEAMAAGVPVIAFEKGGSGETVIDGETGILVHSQTAAAFAKALSSYRRQDYSIDKLQARAADFSQARFADQLKAIVEAN